MEIINKIDTTTSPRTLFTCSKDEAFRLGNNEGCWYSKLQMNDFSLRAAHTGVGKEFVSTHTLFRYENTSYLALMPCIHLPSMELVYVDGNATADEWASLSAVLTTL